MANYVATLTDAGMALMQTVANAAGTLECTIAKAGSGALGETDPTALTDLIDSEQSNNVVDVRQDSNDDWYISIEFSNVNVTTGYLRREMGIFARLAGSPATETLLLYFNAPTDGEADYVPAASSGTTLMTNFAAKIAALQGESVTVTLDQSEVYLPLDRFADHLAGAGGADQHPVATTGAAGLMSAADKTTITNHPGSGGAAHAAATTIAAGFMAAADKAKLDNIPANGIPSGVILMWSGSAATIPVGWKLCDGSNGTPDLRNRFVLGSGLDTRNGYPVHGDVGGESTHTLTLAEMPIHNHTIHLGGNGTSETQEMPSASDNVSPYWEYETSLEGDGLAHNNMPPYYALCFIMKG